MAINRIESSLVDVIVEDVDLALLKEQTDDLSNLLRETKNLSPRWRTSLLGVRQLLVAILEEGEASPSKRSDETLTYKKDKHLVNMARDLFMCGKTATAIARQLNVDYTATRRMLEGTTFADHPYAPTEFAPPNVESFAGANNFPWTKEWEA